MWFEDTYYYPGYIPSCEHTNLINPVWIWSDDCTSATVTFECVDCGTVSFAGNITNSVLNEDDTITFTAEYTLNDVTYTDTKTVNVVIANFIKDEGVERIDVYHTQDYSESSATDAIKAVARDFSTGNPVIDGSGQLNFLIILKEGYLLADLTATEGTYENVEADPKANGNTLLYRLTKMTGNTEVRISTRKMPITVAGVSLSLKEKIEARLYVYVPEEEMDTTQIKVEFDSTTTVYDPKTFEPVTVKGLPCVCIAVPTYARQMRDDIKLTVTDGENEKYLEYRGEDVTSGMHFKVEDYVGIAEQTFKDDTKLIDLVHKMDNYGKYAKIQFNYRLDTFESVDEILETYEDSRLDKYAEVNTGEVSGLEFAGMSLELQSDTGVRVYYRLTGGDAIDKHVFTVDGEAVTPKSASGLYYVSFKGIQARQMHKKHIMTVTDQCGQTLTTACSALTYASRIVRNEAQPEILKKLCRAIDLYAEAALTYFGED